MESDLADGLISSADFDRANFDLDSGQEPDYSSTISFRDNKFSDQLIVLCLVENLFSQDDRTE